VLEGVCCALADGLAALVEGGARPSRLLALGGGARSDTWLQLLADTLDLPIARPAAAEVGPALGAARLAQLGLGLPADRVLRAPAVDRVYTPRADAQAQLAPRLARFRRAYEPLRGLAA
jgi:xylulokinase